jgi:hypothetical protein
LPKEGERRGEKESKDKSRGRSWVEGARAVVRAGRQQAWLERRQAEPLWQEAADETVLLLWLPTPVLLPPSFAAAIPFNSSI